MMKLDPYLLKNVCYNKTKKKCPTEMLKCKVFFALLFFFFFFTRYGLVVFEMAVLHVMPMAVHDGPYFLISLKILVLSDYVIVILLL